MRLRSRKGDGSCLWISCLRRQQSEPGASPAGTPSPATQGSLKPSAAPPAHVWKGTRDNATSHLQQADAQPSCDCWDPMDQGPLLSQAPCAQGWELGPAGSCGPGPPPAP